MPFNMIDTDQRLSGSISQPFHTVDACQQCTYQPRTFCYRQCIQVLQLHTRFLQRLIHYPVTCFHMRTAGNLRHHPAIQFMQIDLAENHIAQNFPSVFHHSRGRLVTACFQRQYPDSLFPAQRFRLLPGRFLISHPRPSSLLFSINQCAQLLPAAPVLPAPAAHPELPDQ